MANLLSLALILDVMAIAVSMECFRHRLLTFLGPHPRREYPVYSDRVGTFFMGVLVIWTGEHREYHDRWLTGFAWAARISMLVFAVVPLTLLAIASLALVR
jgi:hypothetical protein